MMDTEAKDLGRQTVFSHTLAVEDKVAEYWLRQVALRLRRELCWCWHIRGILPEQVGYVLPPFTDRAAESLEMGRLKEKKEAFFREDKTAAFLSERIAKAPPVTRSRAVHGSLGWVAEIVGLDDKELFVLALGLASYFDSAMGSVVAACLNDQSALRPNLALAQRLWDRPERIPSLADPSHPLFSYGLLLHSDPLKRKAAVIDWDAPISVPAPVADQLLFPGSPLPKGFSPIEAEKRLNGQAADRVELIARILKADEGRGLRVVPIRGPKGAGLSNAVSHISSLTGRGVVEFTGDPELLDVEDFINIAATVCWLKGVDLFRKACDPDSSGEDDVHHPQNASLPLKAVPITYFIGTNDHPGQKYVAGGGYMPMVELPGLTHSERIELWKDELGKKVANLEHIITEYSRRYRYEQETIQGISKGLRVKKGRISEEDFHLACSSAVEVGIDGLAQRVTPRFDERDLVLPHMQEMQFQEVKNAMQSLTRVHYELGTAAVWNESGISVLFAGPSGTGKTMAAEVLAKTLNIPMYRVDLSQCVSKWIGETEKNLKRLFDAADVADMVLFFDEADALFGRRTEVKNSHDRFSNQGISYLLERMERFKGMAILATNRKMDLDEAFLRRLRYTIDFPVPGVEQRRSIWKNSIPEGVNGDNIEFDFLARRFSISGGNIRSIIFNACLQSASGRNGEGEMKAKGKNGKKHVLEMEHVIIALKRELDKISRAYSLESFGPYVETVSRMESI